MHSHLKTEIVETIFSGCIHLYYHFSYCPSCFLLMRFFSWNSKCAFYFCILKQLLSEGLPVDFPLNNLLS